MMVHSTQLDRFEEKFQSLRSRAAELPDKLSEIVSSSLGPAIAGDDFPRVTATRQMLTVTPLYYAAIEALGKPESALGALALLRPLLEAWAHLYFIMGEDQMADARCRAIRIESGWASLLVNLIQVGGEESPGDLAIAQRRLTEIERLSSSEGCRGGRRDYSNVDPTLRELARLYSIDWLMGAWKSSSQVIHVSGWDWSVESQAGALVAVDPAPSHRAARLNQLIVLYYNVAQTCLVVLGIQLETDEAKELWQEVRAILDDGWLKRMIDGDFDG